METRKLKDELPKLIQEVTDLPSEPSSLGLAVQIEIIFSQILLQQLLTSTLDNFAVANQLLKFLKTRWEMLNGTAALSLYSRDTKINRACVLTAQRFAFFSKDFVIQEILHFDEICKEKEKEALQCEKQKIEGVQVGSDLLQRSGDGENKDDNEKIYQYIYHTVFANQTIKYAMSMVPRNDEFVKTDNWRKLLTAIIGMFGDRVTFIRMLASQVRREDWRFFISKITHFDLYNLILKLNVSGLFYKHMQKPKEQQDNNEFDLELLAAADELLHRKRQSFLGVAVGTSGEVFKGMIEADHGCETDEEVSALAFCLLETYRRIREKLDEYGGVWSQAASYVTTVCNKKDKEDACDLVMKFILSGESFTKNGLANYIAQEEKNGKLKKPAVDMFNLAINQGALKTLLDTMFEVQKKVARMGLRA
jgi:hypothetical protein